MLTPVRQTGEYRQTKDKTSKKHPTRSMEHLKDGVLLESRKHYKGKFYWTKAAENS